MVMYLPKLLACGIYSGNHQLGLCRKRSTFALVVHGVKGHHTRMRSYRGLEQCYESIKEDAFTQDHYFSL
jgi:hypothetical protein